MIPTGTLSTCPDPASLLLQAEVKRHKARLQAFVATLDPATTPEGVADALHDALTNLTDALQVAESVSWGWNG